MSTKRFAWIPISVRLVDDEDFIVHLCGIRQTQEWTFLFAVWGLDLSRDLERWYQMDTIDFLKSVDVEIGVHVDRTTYANSTAVSPNNRLLRSALLAHSDGVTLEYTIPLPTVDAVEIQIAPSGARHTLVRGPDAWSVANLEGPGVNGD